MPQPQKIGSREAKHGERMVELTVRFWTDGLADGKGRIIPKNVWASGAVRMTPNAAHGIKPVDPKMFNSVMELPAVIEKLLIEHGVTLHASRREGRYRSKSK